MKGKEEMFPVEVVVRKGQGVFAERMHFALRDVPDTEKIKRLISGSWGRSETLALVVEVRYRHGKQIAVYDAEVYDVVSLEKREAQE